MTENSTRLLCGEHGKPLFFALATVFCEDGCDLAWGDLRPEVGERITTREGDEIFAAEVWVEHEDRAAVCADCGHQRDEHEPGADGGCTHQERVTAGWTLCACRRGPRGSSTMEIAQMISTAAELLGREEVRYALGLDYEHVQTVDYVEATLPDGSTRMVEVPRDEAEAVAEMDAAIADHAALVQALDDLARSIAEG